MHDVDLAAQVIRDEADEATVNAVDRWVKSGRAHWRLDPDVNRVVGLVREGQSNRALLVVYLATDLSDSDFEVSADLFDEPEGDES